MIKPTNGNNRKSAETGRQLSTAGDCLLCTFCSLFFSLSLSLSLSLQLDGSMVAMFLPSRHRNRSGNPSTSTAFRSAALPNKDILQSNPIQSNPIQSNPIQSNSIALHRARAQTVRNNLHSGNTHVCWHDVTDSISIANQTPNHSNPFKQNLIN